MEYDPNEETPSVYGENAFEDRVPLVALDDRPARESVISDDDILNLRIALELNEI